MKKYDKFNNAGITLVEIIIVVAIMVALSSVVFIGLGLLTGKPVDECARKLKISIENNRMTTMGKLTASLNIYQDSEGNIFIEEIINEVPETPILIGDSGVNVSYWLVGDVDGTEVPTYPNKLNISFDRSSGGLNKIGSKYFEKFVVSRGNDIKIEVCIDKLTGKVTIK